MVERRTRTGRVRARYERDEAEFIRATAFFDATFAIAATFLVTTIDPGPEGWSSFSNLWEALRGPLLAYGLSFVVIGSYWKSNHDFVGELRALSSGVIVGTLWLLAFIVLLPFTTRGLGESLGSAEVTTVVYAINVALVSATEAVIYRFAVRDNLFTNPPAPIVVKTSLACQLVPTAVFLISIPIALWWSPDAAKWSWLSLAVLSPLAGRWAAARVGRSTSAQ